MRNQEDVYKRQDIHSFEKEGRIFASCAGAAIYRKKVFEKIGYFDEEHFAYLEDIDVDVYKRQVYGTSCSNPL